ncbi:MAG: GNAT family N-acetyltransferase [Chloroflexi bacterium]|nr:GNAT family N-acetyltransferase [Chloroflexota bacterium]
MTTLTLREITKETVGAILNLKVSPEQTHFVADNATSIAEAYFEPKAWFRAIYADETPVGFMMLEDDPETSSYYLWRFMIAEGYQGRGYGRQALELLMAHVRTRPNATHLTLSCVPGTGSPCPFYEKIGFTYTGEEDDGELMMRIEL